MPIEKRIPKNRFLVDFVAYDNDGKPILFGWTTSMKVRPEAIKHLLACLDASRSQIPFAMLADVDQVMLYRKDAGEPAKLVWSSRTDEVLSRYDPRYGQVRIFAQYLRTLIEGWLRDLAYHWKSEAAPFQQEIESVGLLERLKDGTTRREVWLAGNPLS
jgi:hypothetical protein